MNGVRRLVRGLAVVPVLTAALMLTSAAQPVLNPPKVFPDGETEPVAHTGDAADDPAIWVDSDTPADSLVIGNDKPGALEVYNLDGSRRQRITSVKHWGNVDVRQSVRVAGSTRDIVAAINGGLRVFTVNPTTRTARVHHRRDRRPQRRDRRRSVSLPQSGQRLDVCLRAQSGRSSTPVHLDRPRLRRARAGLEGP